MRIAVIQQAHAPGQGRQNLEKALSSVREAARAGADIALFHEEMLYGYHRDGVLRAEDACGETARAFMDALRGTDMAAVYGFTETKDGRRYIAQNAVSRDGVIATYRKTHLWKMGEGLRDETMSFTPGSEFVTFSHAGAKIGLLICYDGDFPECFRAYAKRGCDLVLWANNRESRAPGDRCIRAAADNSLFIATSCCCGTDEAGHACPGNSNIVSPAGDVLCEIEGREGMLLCDIDPADARRARAINPWYLGLRPDLY